MRVFIVGISGGVGLRTATRLNQLGHQATGFVRSGAQAHDLAEKGVSTQLGDIVVMSLNEIADAVQGCDAIVFTAGAGGKDGPDATSLIDGDGPGRLAAAASLAGVDRLLLVSVFPEAWRDRHMDDDFEHYMREKKRAETELVRTNLDWLILRPAALTNDAGAGRIDLGSAKIHDQISRDDVAHTIVELLQTPAIRRVILEVTGGETIISEAVQSLNAADG